MPKIGEELDEISLGIDNFAPVEDNRSSSDELRRIKEYSDENLNLIASQIKTENDDNENRNVIVNLIAALDYYIHEIIIWGLVQITTNKFPKGENYCNVKISIDHLKESIENSEDIFNDTELKKTIIEEFRRSSYQKWREIRIGLKIVLPKKIDEKIADLTSGKNGTIKFETENLEKISNKRHIIVHHFDREYTNNSLRNNFEIDCQESFNLVELIISSIHEIIKEYDDTKPEQ